MSKMSEVLKQCSRSASLVEHSGEIAYVVSRSDLIELTKRIEPLLLQNRRERNASFEEARSIIVK